MENNFEYRVLTKDDANSVVNFCKQENIYLENNLINNICSVEWDGVSTKKIGYGCFNNGELIGYIGCVQSMRNKLLVNDLSCGIVNENYRGFGIASKLFDMSQYDGDLILDLTASEQVYQMFKRKFPRFFDFSEYQLWFNCKKLHRNKNLISEFCIENIKDIVDEPLKKYVIDNSKYSLNFAYFSLENDSCLVAYYTMKKKKILKGFEICFVSNRNFFECHYCAMLKAIAKKHHSFFAFVDKRFLPNIEFKGNIMPRGTNTKQYIKRMCKLLFKKYIKAPNRKFMAIKDNIDKSIIDNIDYLYTEMAFYKDID